MMNFFWSYQQLQQLFTSINFGNLYNGYAVTDSRNLAASGWHVSTYDDIFTYLQGAIGGNQGKLREVNLAYWNSLTNSTNELGFNARGGGMRNVDGSFVDLKATCYIKCTFNGNPTYSGVISDGGYQTIGVSGRYLKDGNTIILVKDNTTLSNSQTGTYTGNDGKVYPTICINGKEFLARPLAETKYRDGSTIPVVTDNTAWAALTTGARCVYDNNESNM